MNLLNRDKYLAARLPILRLARYSLCIVVFIPVQSRLHMTDVSRDLCNLRITARYHDLFLLSIEMTMNKYIGNKLKHVSVEDTMEDLNPEFLYRAHEPTVGFPNGVWIKGCERSGATYQELLQPIA